MKFFTLFIVILTICWRPSELLAQTEKYVYPDAFYFVKEVDVSNYQGKKMKFEISVKAFPEDSLSRARIYAIQCRKGREDFIAKTLKYATHTSDDWQQYTVEEWIEPDAKRIWFYCAVNGNGDFYFDNLKVTMEDENGFIQPIEIENPSFEHKKVLKGYYQNTVVSKDVTAFSDSKMKMEGKQSLHIRTKKSKPGIY